MSNHKEVIYGLYNDEEDLLKAVKKANSMDLSIMDVFTPFPVHGLDSALHLSESRLHQGGFVYGLLGLLTAFLGMTWIFTKDWPIIFGGKPYWSVPAFIPITFEMTVLFAAWGMTITFYIICGLGPGISNEVLDDRITDDKFCIAFNKSNIDPSKVNEFFRTTGAAEVNSKVM
ncbi:MAG: DUF3341 domain-containing protein [Saprospiraceae bacterium]|jgi:hypothetical protein|nr:DUF3341 domain-containing protein [Saprospiraceae bacterium]MBK6481258.1 DUF3341 domain-containing protein [Saprospiraceae bacterium]MBK6817957.1 DUF3341 domain-containing protein [Saprospiraceae bacterium]MBK7370803.1 DUF3341 domain-containing protein [Saprospiraceae bacterium]MBK7436653.1 DUF3341 domain-containing protein [Saprospiraceae bacterium]